MVKTHFYPRSVQHMTARKARILINWPRPAEDSHELPIGLNQGPIKKTNYSFTFRQFARMRRTLLRTLAIFIWGAPALLLAQSWRTMWFGDPTSTDAAMNADPYHTGVLNIQVVAYLGPYQDPRRASPAQLPQVRTGGGNLFYSFTEPFGVSGITYGAQWSATMPPNDWHAVPDTGDPTATPPNHLFSIPMTGTQLYMRLTLIVQ